MGSSKQTTTEQSQQSLPAWENANYQKLVGSSMGSIYGANGQVNGVPAQQQVAGLTGNSTNWFQNAQNSQDIGTNLTANNAYNKYSPNIATSTATDNFNGWSPNIQNAFSNGVPQAANNLSGFNSNIQAQNVGTGQWNDQKAQQYMNPYMSQVLGTQMQLADQQHGQNIASESRAAGASGALGGDRSAINQAAMSNDYHTQQQGMIGQALSNAYTTGQSQYSNDANRALQADLSNSQLGLAASSKNADLNFAALNSGNTLNMQNASLLSQALNSQNATNSENAQLNYAQRAAQNQFGLQNAAFQNQASQLGANLQYGALGATNSLNAQGAQDQLSALSQQQAAAKASQNYAQYGADTDYQNSMNAYLFPQQQLQWASGMQNAMPQQWASDSTSTTVSSPSAFSQIMGGLMGAASAFGSVGTGMGGSKGIFGS